jgi:ubiquinone/menaquinone biosynthesis C-methylase UbiE
MQTPELFSKDSHEKKVYDFYIPGVDRFGDFHGGYLNFGYWEDGVHDYVTAAERLIERLGEMLHLTSESKLLDVACGMGPQDVYLARKFPVGSIDALDLLPEHLEHASRRVREAGLQDRIEFHQGTATKLPFPDTSFTHVLSVEGLIHFNTRSMFFRECHRVLKPGGRVVFADYVGKREPKTALDRALLKLVTKVWHIPFENVASPRQYQEQLERLGFDEVRVHCVGDRVIPGYCREQARPECIAELTRIRGFFAGRIGHIVDIIVDLSFRWQLIDYVLVEGRKR